MSGEIESAKVYNDLKGLNELRTSARRHDPNALHNVAKQFESLFIQMLMKSMRAANESFAEDDMLNSQDVQFYQEMYDQQLSVSLAQGKGIGLADVLERQMSPKTAKPITHETKDFSMTAQKLVSSLNQITQSKIHDVVAPPAPKKIAEPIKPIKAPIYATPVEFVKSIWPSAIASAKKIGVDPKMLVAQAALETGWGKSIIKSPDGQSTNNLFNIKADKNAHLKQDSNHVAIPTIEYHDGIAVRRHENFKKYQSVSDSFSDYVGLLTQNDRYAKALNQANSSKNYIHSLQEGGYATDPHYAEKVYKIYQGDVLHDALAKIR